MVHESEEELVLQTVQIPYIMQSWSVRQALLFSFQPT